jgi:hypothetical protein
MFAFIRKFRASGLPIQISSKTLLENNTTDMEFCKNWATFLWEVVRELSPQAHGLPQSGRSNDVQTRQIQLKCRIYSLFTVGTLHADCF